MVRVIKVEYKSKYIYNKPIQYVGGDGNLFDFINSILKYSGVNRFVEVFGGSGVVSLYAKYKTKIYNEIDDAIVALYKLIKNEPDKVKEYALNMHDYKHDEKFLKDKILNGSIYEKAAATMIYYNYFIRWKWPKRGREGRNKKGFLNKLNNIHYYSRLLSSVTIENLDFRECVRKYDSEDTLFYFDPPWYNVYKEGDRKYRFFLDYNDYVDLYKLLNEIKGYWLFKEKYYPFVFYMLYNYVNKTKNMFLVSTSARVTHTSKGKYPKTEWLFATNYELEKRGLLKWF